MLTNAIKTRALEVVASVDKMAEGGMSVVFSDY